MLSEEQRTESPPGGSPPGVVVDLLGRRGARICVVFGRCLMSSRVLAIINLCIC
jgi:hypothetical protein